MSEKILTSALTPQQEINVDAVLRGRPIDEIMADLLAQISNLVTAGIIPEDAAIGVASTDVNLQPLITKVLIIKGQN